MEYFINNIARLLRKSGVEVSTIEISDCINLLKLLGADKLNKYAFYNLINTTMIKTPWGSDYILWLIELYFGPDMEISRDYAGIFSRTNQKSHGNSCGQKVPLELLMEGVLKNDIRLIYAVVNNLNLDLLIEDPDNALHHFQMQSQWKKVTEIIDQSYHQGDISEDEYMISKETLEEWNNLLKDEVQKQLKKNMSEDYLLQKIKKLNPRKVSFLDSDDHLIALISQEIQKIGRKMAVRKGRRRKIGPKGSINISKTIRSSQKTGNIPLNLIKMQKKPSKPDLWILCDMSNSVSKFIYFMLMFVYSTQNQYTHIRTFLFVDHILETTEYFQDQDWTSALNNLSTIKGYNLTGYSHYGNVFNQFSNAYLSLLTKKTTVIILGDAKNNWHNLDSSEILARIKDMSAALYWLNPLPTNLWGKEDCIMNQYQPNCTGAFPCSNIEELELFLSSI
ncbi:MAG: VWA domain-containing protein [Eubacteriaceae bacterium]